MKAWEIRDNRLGLHDVEPPQPGAHETVVHISHTGICGSDVPKLHHPTRFTLPQPWRPGHEIAGTDPTGRTVAVDPLLPCQTCHWCRVGDSHLCHNLQRIGWDLLGGFAEQVRVPTTHIHPLPDHLGPLHAVLADPAAVAIHGLRCTPISPPGQLAVIGAGTIGFLTALYAHQQGWQVTVIHRDHHAPPPDIIDAIPTTFRPPLATEENAFDVVVDAATGAEASPLALALDLVRDGGSVIVQNAYHPGVALPLPLRDLFRRSIRLIGSYSHCRRPPGDFHLGLALIDQYTDSTQHLVTEVGHLTDLRAFLHNETTPIGRQALTIA